MMVEIMFLGIIGFLLLVAAPGLAFDCYLQWRERRMYEPPEPDNQTKAAINELVALTEEYGGYQELEKPAEAPNTAVHYTNEKGESFATSDNSRVWGETYAAYDKWGPDYTKYLFVKDSTAGSITYTFTNETTSGEA